MQQVKPLHGYDAAAGAALGTETTARSAFDPASYVCDLSELTVPGAHAVSGRFRKAGGQVGGINLSGRPVGTTAWQRLGRFTATPLTAAVPLTGTGLQEWEFRAVAVRRD